MPKGQQAISTLFRAKGITEPNGWGLLGDGTGNGGQPSLRQHSRYCHSHVQMCKLLQEFFAVTC